MKSNLLICLLIAITLVWLSSCSPAAETGAPGAAHTLSAPDRNSSVWAPAPGISFQIQFSGEIELSVDAEVFDLDAFETDAVMVEQLHQAGRKVICYVNAGASEDWRPDAVLFPAEVIGKAYAGWPGENWLDIRQIETLAPILQARMDLCASKGFDGVEFDNVDGYLNKTGFPLTVEDQLTFNIWLADQAHQRGLAAGLKNDPEQIPDLEPFYDFAILENCFEQGWCEIAALFIESAKAVFAIEYNSIDAFCEKAQELHISLIGKPRELGAARETCFE
ncbi:MAG: endo alpha-1,4 polygalactosaminidase [Anaerolinea sp.]|nr:endo alpha-1,4 polygalactosaminidase [Anaerolinea sp.]